MAKIDKKVSTLIPYQFPSFYREDRPELVDFIQKYYEFMESTKLYFSNKVYHEFSTKIEKGTDIEDGYLILEDETAEDEVSHFVLESDRNYTLLNIEIDHYDKGEIIVGDISGAQFLVTARERIVRVTDKTHLMPDGTIMKDSEHDLDVVYGHFLNDRHFIQGEYIVGQTNRLQSTFEKVERNPLAISRDIENLFNIDFTIDSFINKFYDELAPYIPRNIEYDKDFILKHIKDLYISKGNEDSFRFLFKLIFPDSNVDFYYPKQDMLRVSDGKWVVETVIRIGEKEVKNPHLLEGMRVYGQFSKASASVNSLRIIPSSGIFGTLELVISDLDGEFIIGEFVLGFDNDTEEYAGGRLQSVLEAVEVISGGKNYEIGQKLSITGGGGSGAEAVVKTLQDGVVDSIAVNDPGDGYFVGDFVEFNNGGTGGSGASAIVEEIIPVIDFKIIDQIVSDVKNTSINSLDYGGTLAGHNCNTHLLSESFSTVKVTFDPEVSGTLFKQGDWIEVNGSSNTISGVVVDGDGSSSSITGANTVLIALRSGVYSNDIEFGDTLVSYDTRTGRTSSEIDNAIDLVSTGASGTVLSIEEVGENPAPFGTLSGTEDYTGTQYFGALTYTTTEMGGILSIQVLEGGTQYDLEPIVSVTNEIITAYSNDRDSVGDLTRILKFNSNSALDFTYGNYIRGSVAISISGAGSDFTSLEYVRGLSSDAIGLYVKSLGSGSEYNLYSSDDTLLITHIPTTFLSLANTTLTGTFTYGEVIKGRSSRAEAIYLYHVGDSGVSGTAPGNTIDEIRIITLKNKFLADEEIYGVDSSVEANTASVSYITGPNYIEFESAETIKGLYSSIQRTVVTAPGVGDPVFYDAPEAKIVGPISDTANTTYSELRVYPDLSKPDFDNDHYIVEYKTSNYSAFSGSSRGQLRSLDGVEIDSRIKGYLHSRIYVDNITSGAIQSIEVTKFGQGFTGIPTVTGGAPGQDAVLKAIIGTTATYPGKYVGTQGLLDSIPKIQDSYYYQVFSYVLKTDIDVAGSQAFKNVIKKILHPAGLAVFGEIFIVSELDLSVDIHFELHNEIFTDLNVEVLTDPEHEIEIFSGKDDSLGVSARLGNEFIDEKFLLEDWEYIDGPVETIHVQRAFGEIIYLEKEDGDYILADIARRQYLLVEPMFPDMAPLIENMSIILEDGRRYRVDENIFDREVDYLLMEDSTDEWKIRVVTEFEFADNDITIDVGPEWFEDFDWETEIQIGLYQNVEIDTDREHEIEIEEFGNVETNLPTRRNLGVGKGSDYYIEIHQKDLRDVDANTQVLIEENHEIQFGIFHGHVPMSDGPIFYWEEAIIGGQLGNEISAHIEYEDYSYHKLVTERNNWFRVGEKLISEDFEFGNLVTEDGQQKFILEDYKILTEFDEFGFESFSLSFDLTVEYFLTEQPIESNDNNYYFLEEIPRLTNKELLGHTYYIITEPDLNDESFVVSTDELFPYVYEDVQIFGSLQVYGGRHTPDDYRNLLEEDYEKNSYVSRIRPLEPYGYVFGTSLGEIEVSKHREIEVILPEINIQISLIQGDVEPYKVYTPFADVTQGSLYYVPEDYSSHSEIGHDSIVTLPNIRPVTGTLRRPYYIDGINLEIKNAFLDYVDPDEVFPEQEILPIINTNLPLAQVNILGVQIDEIIKTYHLNTLSNVINTYEQSEVEFYLSSVDLQIKNAFLDYADPYEFFPEQEQIPVIEVFLNGDVEIKSTSSEILLHLRDFYADLTIDMWSEIELNEVLESVDANWLSGYPQTVSKEYIKGGASLSDGPISGFLSMPITFFLTNKVPTGLQLYKGDEIIENSIEIFNNDVLTGTATIINNSKTVTGINTLFTQELSLGDYLITKETINSQAQKFIVANIVNDTTLELNIEFTGSYNSEELLKEVAI